MSDRPRICFNAIVKNEEAVILRCLKSFAPWCDTWCIVDTGSTDRTMELITNFFAEQKMEGQLHSRPWVDFEFNRNEALDLARAMLGPEDYCLCADADEELTTQAGFKLPSPMTATKYDVAIEHGCTFHRPRFYQAYKYSWAYPTHEALLPEKGVIEYTVYLDKILIKSYTDGARAKDAARWLRDAASLDAAIAVRERGELWRGRELQLSRLYFYSGNSYYHAGAYEKALEQYTHRIKINEFDQETFQAYYMMAKVKMDMKKDRETIMGAFLQAYAFRPSRYEPIYHLIKYLMDNGDYEVARLFADRMLTAEIPGDTLFVEKWAYAEGKRLARILLKPTPSDSIQLATQQYLHKRWTGVLETLKPLKLKTLSVDEKFTYFDLSFIAHSWLGKRADAIAMLKRITEMPLKHWKRHVYRLFSYYVNVYKEPLESLPREVQLEYLIQEAQVKKKDEQTVEKPTTAEDPSVKPTTTEESSVKPEVSSEASTVS